MPKVGRSRRTRARRNRSSPIMKKPPQIQIIPTVSTVARFVNRVSNAGPVNLSVSTINIVNSGGCLATGSNTMYPIHGFFKVKRIRLWSAPNAVTSFNQAPTIGIRWFNTIAGTLGDTNSQASDTSLSPNDVAFVDTVPPAGSAASWWSGPSTNTLFNVFSEFTTSIVMDLHLDWKINDNANGAVTSITTANAMNVGNIYFPPLDGVSAALWFRLGVPTIN